MVGLKGYSRTHSAYDTHNYCSKCEKWLALKPDRCPDCNKPTRRNTHYSNGRYHAKNVHRY